MSAIVLNIVVGLMTSILSGGAVWAWGRARLTRRQRERARFFGVSHAGTCRIVAPQAFGGTYGVGDLTEFCVGGPTANVRMQSHLARAAHA